MARSRERHWFDELREFLSVGVGGAVETELRHSFHPNRVDLYHEPNFFPVASRVPTVVTVHDLSAVLHPEWHPAERAKQFVEEFLPRVSEFAHILTDSDSARDEIIRVLNLKPERVTSAYPGIREGLRICYLAESTEWISGSKFGPHRPERVARF
jgi:hypothetical protein